MKKFQSLPLVEVLSASGTPLIVLAFFGAWQAIAGGGDGVWKYIPPPSSWLLALWQMTFSGELPWHLYVSLSRSLIGLAIGAVLAIPLGIAMGWWRVMDKAFMPILEF